LDRSRRAVEDALRPHPWYSSKKVEISHYFIEKEYKIDIPMFQTAPVELFYTIMYSRLNRFSKEFRRILTLNIFERTGCRLEGGE
jgi:hypothetical protein